MTVDFPLGELQFWIRYAVIVVVSVAVWIWISTPLVGWTGLGACVGGIAPLFVDNSMASSVVMLVSITSGALIGLAHDTRNGSVRRKLNRVSRKHGHVLTCPDCDTEFRSIQKLAQCPTCNHEFLCECCGQPSYVSLCQDCSMQQLYSAALKWCSAENQEAEAELLQELRAEVIRHSDRVGDG